MYYRYTDDTFHLFKNEKDANSFLLQLNSMHLALKFTVEKESNHQLAFLDVLVHITSIAFLTSVYRKPTFSGRYTRWDSFCPQQRKINLIKTLVYRALMISSNAFLMMKLSSSGQPCLKMDIHCLFWIALSMMFWIRLIGLKGALLVSALFICVCRI